MKTNQLANTKKTLETLGYEVDEEEFGHIYFRNKQIHGCVVTQPERNINEVMIRVSSLIDFDRWANSTAFEKVFDSQEKLIQFLTNNQVEIYQAVIDYLEEIFYDDAEE